MVAVSSGAVSPDAGRVIARLVAKNMRAAIRFSRRCVFIDLTVLLAFPLYVSTVSRREKRIVRERGSGVFDSHRSRASLNRSFLRSFVLNKETISIATTCTVNRVCLRVGYFENEWANLWETTGMEDIKSGAAQIRVVEWKRKCPIGTLFNEERESPTVLGTVRGCR